MEVLMSKNQKNSMKKPINIAAKNLADRRYLPKISYLKTVYNRKKMKVADDE
jgi:hypothetical protein